MKPKPNEPLSNFALKSNLRRYTKVLALREDAARSKATTTVGRLIKAAANAAARADQAAEADRAMLAKQAERDVKVGRCTFTLG